MHIILYVHNSFVDFFTFSSLQVNNIELKSLPLEREKAKQNKQREKNEQC